MDQIGNPYDITGLAGWLFKSFDDPENYYCSEICYDACKVGGIVIAEHKNPSPYDIVKFMEKSGWVIYTK